MDVLDSVPNMESMFSPKGAPPTATEAVHVPGTRAVLSTIFLVDK